MHECFLRFFLFFVCIIIILYASPSSIIYTSFGILNLRIIILVNERIRKEVNTSKFGKYELLAQEIIQNMASTIER